MIEVIQQERAELGSVLSAFDASPPSSQSPGSLRALPSSEARPSLPPPGPLAARPNYLNCIWLSIWLRVGMQLWCIVCAAAALALWLD